MEHIRSVLDENGWDFKKASRVLEISEKRLLREARSFAGQAIAGRAKGMGKK